MLKAQAAGIAAAAANVTLPAHAQLIPEGIESTDEAWSAELLDANPGFRGRTLYDVLFANGVVNAHGLDDVDPDYANQEAAHFGFYVQKGLFDRAANIHSEYLLSGRATCIDCHKGIAHDLPDMTGVEPGWLVPPELQGDRFRSERQEESLLEQLRDYLPSVEARG